MICVTRVSWVIIVCGTMGGTLLVNFLRVSNAVRGKVCGRWFHLIRRSVGVRDLRTVYTAGL